MTDRCAKPIYLPALERCNRGEKMTGCNTARVLVLGAALIIILSVAIVGISMVRRGLSARDHPSWIEAFVTRQVRGMAVPTKAKGVKNPIPNTPSNMEEAKAHWADHCAICHDNNGSGNTTIGQNLYPKAPDMRLPATQNMSDGELYYTIENGVRLTGMPAWGQAEENDQDSWRLVHFIRHLPQMTAEEEEEMKRMNPKTREELEEEIQEEQFLNPSHAQRKNHRPTHQNH